MECRWPQLIQFVSEIHFSRFVRFTIQNDNRKALTILYQGFVYRIQYYLIKSLQRIWLQIFSNLGIKSQPLFKQNYLTPVINSVWQDILSIGHAFPPYWTQLVLLLCFCFLFVVFVVFYMYKYAEFFFLNVIKIKKLHQSLNCNNTKQINDFNVFIHHLYSYTIACILSIT